MRGLLAKLALGGALLLAVPAPGLAMGRFDSHGALHKHGAPDPDAVSRDTPEIDGGAAAGALVLVLAGLQILADRRRRS
jgi:hypothetical protein